MKRSSLLTALVISGLVALGTTSLLDVWPTILWRFSGASLAWPTIERYDLNVDLTTVGRFEADVLVELSDIREPRVPLLLNKDLEVNSALAGDVVVGVRHARSLPSSYHREGRAVLVELPSVPADGRVSLRLRYAGEAAHGRRGSDWRGILFVDRDETRMCEQTVFYPQVPLSLGGPAVAEAPFSMTVVAPGQWELFVPAPGGVVETDAGTRTWHFSSERPQILSLLGGVRERTESNVDGAHIVTLLRAEHAHLAPGFVREASAAIVAFTRRFGIVDASVVGIVEISCRNSSYNWTSEGVLAFDKGVLINDVPVRKIAHEVAHLWWGQAVTATGPGERFLTEGLAEYSAWSYLIDAGRGTEVSGSIDRARQRVAELVGDGRSTALADVAFGIDDYQTLAYLKGALVLHTLRGQLAPGQLDGALRQLVDDGDGKETTLAAFRTALAEQTGFTELHVPWIDSVGDLDLALEDVRVDSNTVTATVRGRWVPARADARIAGTPVAIVVGGPTGSVPPSWRERRTVLLEGDATEVTFDIGERSVSFVRLDPDDAWSRPVADGLVVLDGARLVDAVPLPGAVVQFGGTRIALFFDRPLAPITHESLQTTPLEAGMNRPVLRDVTIEDDGKTLVVETAPWWPDRGYRLPLSRLTDHDGLPVVPIPYGFKVAPSTDETRPRIIATSPSSGAQVVAPGGELDLSFTFDELMRPGYSITSAGVGDIKRRGYSYPDFEGFGVWDAAGSTITYHVVGLVPGRTYAVPVRSRSFADVSGNACEEFDLLFTVIQGE